MNKCFIIIIIIFEIVFKVSVHLRGDSFTPDDHFHLGQNKQRPRRWQFCLFPQFIGVSQLSKPSRVHEEPSQILIWSRVSPAVISSRLISSEARHSSCDILYFFLPRPFFLLTVLTPTYLTTFFFPPSLFLAHIPKCCFSLSTLLFSFPLLWCSGGHHGNCQAKGGWLTGLHPSARV